ncbi:hypothetical protein E2C01_032981 [Portunus trituberculatus]|uniref:Uncharacterized protein n=1 Tax=Portunus trituberculatus TaxID=210409 RepID=A0A5B7F4E5_PORTR|nr:hypothetical protein [Portunus trituberculatus]
MRFSREEVVFYRLKIRCKTANVAEVNEEKVERDVKKFGSTSIKQSDLRTFMIPSPEGDFEAEVGVAITPYIDPDQNFRDWDRVQIKTSAIR